MLKSAWSEQGFLGASACLQVLGGHGYVSEWGMEQIVRDSRVAMIYEGTNEIQAIDLLVRKVLPDGGQALDALLAELQADMPPSGQARCQRLRALVAQIMATSVHDASLPCAVADDFLRALAMVLMDWAWALIVATPGSHTPRWQAPALAFARHVRPEFNMRLEIISERCLEVQHPPAKASA